MCVYGRCVLCVRRIVRHVLCVQRDVDDDPLFGKDDEIWEGCYFCILTLLTVFRYFEYFRGF